MVATPDEAPADYGEWIATAVAGWPGVTTRPHRFGAVAFVLDDREIGHLHGGRVLDVNFPKRIRDALVESGDVDEHRFAGGGWTTFAVESGADVDHALWLLRLSYVHTALLRRNRPSGRAVLAELDVDDELAWLDPSEPILAVVERLRPS